MATEQDQERVRGENSGVEPKYPSRLEKSANLEIYKIYACTSDHYFHRMICEGEVQQGISMCFIEIYNMFGRPWVKQF